MDTVRWMISAAPEIFLLLSIAIGTVLGRVQDSWFLNRNDSLHTGGGRSYRSARNLYIPVPAARLLFSLFVFTIGYRSGPEFFASLSIRTLAQVAMALVLGGTGLILVLVFAFAFKLDPGTASGLAAGGLTQSSIIGTASGALAQVGLSSDALKQQEANIAAGYAVTYVLGYILTLLYVPFVAPKLMRIDLKAEAAKLEAELAGGNPPPSENLHYRKFQARAYRVSAAAGRTVKDVEEEIGSRTVVEQIVRREPISSRASTASSNPSDDIVVAGRPPPLSRQSRSSARKSMPTKS